MAKRLKVAPENPIPTFKLRPLPACIRMAVASGVLMGAVTPAAQAELPIPAQVLNSMGINESLHYHGDTLQINQSTQNAIYNWQEYNVGVHNKVEYNQPNSSSIALNKILQDSPSQILGEITSNGQVYLYNQNGFVFGKDSVVDVNTLVASSLKISDDVLTAGLTQQSTAALNKPALGDDSTKAGSAIIIEQGAKITATGDANNDGLVIMAAPTVTNNGSIATNEFGQVILVASQDKVYLQPSQNSQFKGLLVEVDTGGKVTNAGDILTRQGNITLEGFAVNQGGALTATTSVNVNGSIRLLAQEKHGINSTKLYATSTTRDADRGDGLGTKSSVTFGEGSVTQILADTVSTDTAIDGKAQVQSYMEVVADQIELKSHADIVAPYAQVNMLATNNLANDVDTTKADFTVIHNAPPTDNPNKARILVDANATIDVSGIQHVQVAMDRNVGQVSVQTYDLRDAPFQKGGVLQGQTVLVDTRKTTTIVDTSGATNGVSRTVQERLTQGGSINLSSNGDVILNSGAVVNISGGSVDYQSGYINTTKLVTDYGKIVDISVADPNQHYVSIFGVVNEVHAKWGVTNTWNNTALFGQGVYEQGYTEGKDAGSINIETPLLSWNANLIAGANSGVNQRALTDTPFGGSFIVNATDVQGGALASAQNVLFQKDGNGIVLGLNDAFPTQADGTASALTLSDALMNNSGVQKVLVRTGGNISIAKDAAIDRQGADIELSGGSINVEGSVHAAGGTIGLSTNVMDTSQQPSAVVNLSSSAVLDVSGRWINDYQLGLSATPTDALRIDGGSVKVTAQGDLTTAAGSVIRADGGAHLSVGDSLTEGKGGAITLAAVGYVDTASALHLHGQLSAWGLLNGGTLSLTSGRIDVGSADTASTSSLTPFVLGVSNGNFDLLANSGFSGITLNSNYDSLTVSGDTHLKLLAQNRVLESDYREQASANSLAALTSIETLSDNLRNPVNLTLKALSGIKLATGSEIIADTGAAISLDTLSKGIYVDGTVAAPAGSIDLTIKAENPISTYDATQAIWLGSHAQLLAQGTTKMDPLNGLNVRSGEVLDGGTVTLTANEGYVIQEKGGLIDVSGTKAVLDLPVIDPNTLATIYKPTTVGSNAGSIAIAAGEGIDLEGSVQGHAGSSGTKNGRLDVELNASLRNLDSNQEAAGVFPERGTIIQITQHTGSVLGKFKYGDKLDNFVSNNIVPAKGSLSHKARISSDFIEQGGFSDLRLTSPNEIRFVGDVSLHAKERIELDSQKIGWSWGYTSKGVSEGSQGNHVNLDTAYLKAGWDTFLTTPDTSGLRTGAGHFTANSQWTDLFGYLSMVGFAQANLNSVHELRASGYYDLNQHKYIGFFNTAANLNLTASQIYPSTLTEYTFTVDKTLNPEGSITISGNKNSDATPLSANGILSFVAPDINQNGVVKAPFGSINLTASTNLTLGEKSITSVAADAKTIPFGNTLGGLFWTYALSGRNLVFNESSQGYLASQTKKVNLSAPSIALAKGGQIDVSGGGDLKAYEFIAGAGGSTDYLLPGSASYKGGFAIVPSQGSASLNPYDPHEQSLLGSLSAVQQGHYAAGSQIYLSGADGVPAGTYTIMPAHYALLAGAYLVTPQANTQDQTVTVHNSAGQEIVSGYYTNSVTGTRDARTSGFLIESGSVIRQHSQYTESTANTFFTAQAATNGTSVPLIPKDSGQIAIDVANQLLLEGSVNSAAATDSNGVGRGGKLDIASNNGIKIVDTLTASTDSSVQIKASDLSNLNLDSLFLGGTRTRDNATGETDLTVTTTNVEVDSGADLTVKDLVIAAKNDVTIQGGATLRAGEAVNTGDTVYKVAGSTGYGALLRVSSDQQVSLSSASVLNKTAGTLSIGSGATITGITSGSSTTLASVLLDSSTATHLASDANILMKGGSLSLNANAINMGEVSSVADANALSLTNLQLTNLAVDELLLNSRSSINFYGDVAQVGSNGQFLKNGNDNVALQFGNLTINAAGFADFGSQNTVKLQADTLTVGNSTGVSATAGTGNGRLDITTNAYTQAAGAFAINGFNTVNMSPLGGSDKASQFHIDGTSILAVAGDLNVTADYLTATGGADLTVDAAGHNVTFNNAGHADSSVSSGFGATVSVAANTVDFNTNALLFSGKLALHATNGNVTVGDQADISLQGKAVQFADVVKYTPGGIFSAEADQGNITLTVASKLNLDSGGGGAAGGQLVLKAPTQTVDLLGTVTASSGSAVVELAQFDAAASFDQWMANLQAMGISGSLYFRSTEADIVQQATDTIKAGSVTLVADKGAIALSGTVNTQNATQGGAIELYAGDKITLASGSVLTTTGAKGGDVLLSSVDSDKDGVSGISIKSGASIDVSGSAQGGNVTLRALRDANTVINIGPIAANTVKGAHNYYAEGVQKYTNTDISNGVIDSTTIATLQADTANYMSAANIAKVSSSIDSSIQLRPDVEIDYSGDLKVGSAWDFATWRYGNGIAGNLQISASGQLTVAAPITDGYEDGFDSNFNPIVVLQNGNSWSYQLTAGADAGSADRSATINNVANDLVLSQSVHTGVGGIKLASGGDILFTNKNATVYTGGKQTDTDPYGSLISDYLGNSDYNTLSGAEYGVDGGKVVISADHNIQGVNSSQFLTDWLVSTGNSTSNIATAWGVIAGNFKQNIGSFGGGDVSVNAGGNINDLSVMMPSTGKQIAPATAGTNDSGQTIPIFTSNEVQVQGGGQLSVHASGDIAGGAYLLGKGAGAISADGQITGGKQFVNGPQLVMGDSTLALAAKQGISITAVSDQMTVSKSTQFYTYSGTSGISVNSLSGDVTLGADTSIIRDKLGLTNVSSSYAVTTSVYPANLDATAFGGNIALDTLYLFPSVSGKVSVLAQQGISAITDKNTQLPKVNAGIIMRDIDMSLLPTATAPGGNDPGFATYFQDRSTTTTAVNLLHADDKDPARIVAQTGDISNVSLVLSKKAIIQAGSDLKNVKLDLQNINATDTTILSAGRDLFQQTLLSTAGLLDLSPIKINYIQLSGPGDLLVKTGRNLDLGISNGLVTRGNELNANLTSAGANITVMSGLNGHDLNYTGFISHYLADYPTDNNFSSVSALITTFMQGRLGDSTLSTADALKLFKNLDAVDYSAIQSKLTALILPVYEKHSNLSYQGVSNADIIAALSDSSSVKYNAMVDKYLQHFAVAEQFNTAPATITAFMRDRTGNTELTDAQALVLFEGLNSNDYLSIEQKLNNALLPIYYNEIKEAGAASASDKTLGNDRAYAAIDTLFPGSALKTTDTAFPWQGDISMAFSTIQTGEGGNINLLVPGGKITAGLSFAFPGLDYNRETNPNGKSPSDLGIIAQQAGDINAFSRSDFLVNLSRVFTQAGGNIAIWSTEGNIDAGRGAKTALTVPETVVSYSTSGKLTIVKPSVAGSGIRAAAKLGSNSGQGDVALFAPGGVVNAGEAGIGGKNVTISATQVLGSNNIQVGGVSTGVPAASVGSLAAGLSGLSNLSASVSQIAQAATETNEKDSEKKRKAAKLGILSVDFLGHGDDSKPKPRPAS